MNIKELSEAEQPREKLIHCGVRELSDKELLAVLLGSGIKGKNVLELSAELLESVDNNLTLLANLSLEEMTQTFSGIGEVKAMHLLAALELGRRHNLSRRNVSTIKSAKDVIECLYLRLADLETENFWCIFLNVRNKIIATRQIAIGGKNNVVVDIRIVMHEAIKYNAAGIVFAHNHPSGDPTPSAADTAMTSRMINACKCLDIHFIDHIIITSDLEKYYSFQENDRLDTL
ncbi:MAG: DNA repair protein RadC [Paludibacteraceae bacterium]|nr:DNA repair protein RadC [Paludibacteraceae bacterium]